MNLKFAKAVSYIFHPSIIPTIIFAVVLFGYPSLVPININGKLYLLGFVFFFTFIAPASIVYLLYKGDFIKSLTMENREERLLPFTISTIFYTATAYLFVYKLHSFLILSPIISSIALALLLTTIVTFFYKISAHAIGISGLLGIAFALQNSYPEFHFMGFIVCSILGSGLLLSARLALNAHTPKQVFSGFILGFSVCYSYMMLMSF